MLAMGKVQRLLNATPSFVVFLKQAQSSAGSVSWKFQRNLDPLASARLIRCRCFATTSAKQLTSPSSLKRDERRKHFWTYDELAQRTDTLLRIVRSPSSEQAGTTTIHDCYDVMEAWMELAKEGVGLEAATRAQALLDELERNLENGRQNVFVPKVSFYDVVLQAYAISGGKRDAAEAAQKLVERMLSRCRAYTSRNDHRPGLMIPIEPTSKSFNIAINCWAKSGEKDAGYRAEELIQWMEQWQQECKSAKTKIPYSGCFPNERTMVSAVDAWARSRHAIAPERAQFILSNAIEEQEQLVAQGRASNDTRISAALFNAVIYTWARSNRGREAATRAEEILETMVHMHERGELGKCLSPTTRTYAIVLDAWAQCESNEAEGEAAARAEKILHNMIRLYREGVDVKPNLFSFTTCIAAWSRCRDVEDAPERAERLFDLLVMLYDESDDGDFKPSTETGNAVIAAWSRANSYPDSIRRVFSALDKLKLYSEPDLISYNTVLDGMGKRGLSNHAMKMLEWLERKGQAQEELRPDLISYNSVLAAVAKNKDTSSADHAEALLQKMNDLANDGRDNVKPDKVSYTLVLDALSLDNDAAKAKRAQSLVRDMVGRYEKGDESLKPDVFVFTVLMKVCSQTSGTSEDKRTALKVALEAMDTLQTYEYGLPNHVAYLTLVTAINCLADGLAERTRLLASTFQSCAATGHVSKQVIAAVLRGTQGLELRELNPDWSRNVPKRNKPYVRAKSD